MRIDVSGASARLYVNGASQPCLIVNDLKRGSEGGRIAFWAHVETDAYFGALSVAPIDGRSSPSPLGARGAFFALSVRDLAASRDWYASTFGMHVALATPGTASTPAFALLEGDHLLVELIQSGPSAPQSNRPPGTVPGLFKAGMLVDDLDSAVAVLRARHVEIAFGPFPVRSDQRSNVIVRDPSGNLIQLIGR
jgi:catechol 2,3-dioxygenase-like lactoylglutathione lyase family enzyme